MPLARASSTDLRAQQWRQMNIGLAFSPLLDSAKHFHTGAYGKIDIRRFEDRARLTLQPLILGFAWQTVAFFGATIAGLAAISTLALAGRIGYALAIPANAILIYLIFTPLHEAVHSNIAGRHAQWRWFELSIGHVSGFLLLMPFPGVRCFHLRHHWYTNDPVRDPDSWLARPSLTHALLRCFVGQPVYVWRLGVLARENPDVGPDFALEMAYVAGYAAITAAAFALGVGAELLLLWYLPAYSANVVIFFFVNWPLHHGCEIGRYANTNVLLLKQPLNLLANLALMGQTYHYIHHLYPRIPLFDYRTAAVALAPELAAIGLPIRRVGV